MTPAGVYEMGTSPSCLASNAAGTRLYSANETDRVGEDKEGTVSAFAIDRADGASDAAQHRPLRRRRADVRQHPSVRAVRCSWPTTSAARSPCCRSARRAARRRQRRQEGRGQGRPHAGHQRPAGHLRHQRARPHARPHDPGRPVRPLRLHADLGLDQIFVWKFDEQTRRADPERSARRSRCRPATARGTSISTRTAAGSTRVQEEGSTVVRFDYDAATGRLTPRQTISTLPAGLRRQQLLLRDPGFGRRPLRLRRQPPARQHRHLLDRPPTATLTLVGEEWTRGNYPRSFTFDPTGRFLYCCNQRGDNVTVFRGDRKTGGLSFTGHYAPVGNPSHIVFLDLETKK